MCVPSRWKVLLGEFRRRPTALAIIFRKSDRVGRRGLSEPGGIFSRLITYAFPWLHSDDPKVVETIDEFLQRGVQFFDTGESCEPEQLLLECSNESFDTAVALWTPDE